MDLSQILRLHAQTESKDTLNICCACGWSSQRPLAMGQNEHIEHVSSELAEFVDKWIEYFCDEVSQALISYVSMFESAEISDRDVTDAMLQKADLYAERAADIREFGEI